VRPTLFLSSIGRGWIVPFHPTPPVPVFPFVGDGDGQGSGDPLLTELSHPRVGVTHPGSIPFGEGYEIRDQTRSNPNDVGRMEGTEATGRELLVSGLLLIVALAIYTRTVLRPKLQGT